MLRQRFSFNEKNSTTKTHPVIRRRNIGYVHSIKSLVKMLLLFISLGTTGYWIGVNLEPMVMNTNTKDVENHLDSIHNGLESSKWKTFSSSELNKYFGCKQLFKTPRPIITEKNWMYFRDLYNKHAAFRYDKDVSYKFTNETYVSPVKTVLTKDKGRGLIASRDIQKGELIFTGTNNTIVFETGHAWRSFLWYLYHASVPDYPEGFACDIKSWSWVQESLPNGKGGPVIVVDIDESSLLNQPSRNNGEVANIQCGKGENCGVNYYAKMDIKKGDEILCRYSGCSEATWDDFGL